MKIVISTLPHNEQRYDTVGDWYHIVEFDPQIQKVDVLNIKVSKLRDWRYEMLVAVHELVEALVCKEQGITQETVDAFDMSHEDKDDPGSLSNCPYLDAHTFATFIESQLALKLGVDWDSYDKAVLALSQEEIR